MNRRFFLKSAGGAVLAAPLLTSLRDPARASAPVAPVRNVFFHTPCGCLTNRWFPKIEDGTLDAGAISGTTLEVLTPFVDKLLVPRGLRGINQFGSPQVIDPHHQAMGSKLTCAPLAETMQRYPISHSVDQEMARQINPNGADPLVMMPSVTSSTSVSLLLSYSAPETPFPAINKASSVYAALGGILVENGDAEWQRRRGQSIIDAVRDDLATYQRLEMSRADRQRVDAWLEILRNAEQGIMAQACDPSRVDIDADAVAEASAGTTTEEAFTVEADMMMKLMALAMLCDVNRSFILTFPGWATFTWLNHSIDHDALAHRSGTGSSGGACYDGVLDRLREIDAWYAGKFAKLVDLFDSLPEGEGTLLDNTAATWINEFSDGGAMNLTNMPIIIAGSAGGYLRQGAVVNLEGTEIGPGHSEDSCYDGSDGVIGPTGSTTGNVPINKLYVTLMNAVGCRNEEGGPVESFGVFDGATIEGGITNPGELVDLKA